MWRSAKDSALPSTLAINSDYKRSLLEGLELFHGVDPNDVQDALQRCDRRDIAAAELLLSELRTVIAEANLGK